jgi:hypothetical protein
MLGGICQPPDAVVFSLRLARPAQSSAALPSSILLQISSELAVRHFVSHRLRTPMNLHSEVPRATRTGALDLVKECQLAEHSRKGPISGMYRTGIQVYSLRASFRRPSSFHLYSTVSLFITWFPTLFRGYSGGGGSGTER